MAGSDFSGFQRGLPYLEETRFKILTSPMENGAVQKRNKWHTNQKVFTINFKANTKAEALEIRDYFISNEGSYDTFTFTEPLESTEYTVRFEKDSLKIERENFGTFNITINLIEEI